MDHVLTTTDEQVRWITLNRVEKHNAFDERLLQTLCIAIQEAEADDQVRVIILNAQGKHFSAGADLQWMQRMVNFSAEENEQDAMILAQTLHTLYQCAKPTIAMAQGSALGGGVGLVAACDIAIASEQAQFSFSEVKLGLIPAVISPYVIRAIGDRMAAWLFMTAEVLDAAKAQAIQLIHHCVAHDTLRETTTHIAKQMAQWPKQAVLDAKALVRQVNHQPINQQLLTQTAKLIAQKRVSTEAQHALHAFLHKT